jgi:ferredoxin/truncated hemoglobin YjbI
VSDQRAAQPFRLEYEGRQVAAQAGETVLDALLRVGVNAPFSCKGGSCHTCLMQCTEGALPAASQQGLSQALTQRGYFLPCQCQPQADMALRPPRPEDLLTTCQLCEVTGHGDGALQLIFEPQGTLRYRLGQVLRLVMPQGGDELEIRISSNPASDLVMQGVMCLPPGVACPPGFGPDAEFGQVFEVRGPYDAMPAQELEPPANDAALWHELGEGATVRAVLEAFYAKVYAHPQLNPFFRGVTMERAIDKQYSFLWQSMTGQKVYMGDRPRNAHHWMIITHALFDLRQSLMEETLREHGLSASQIHRWSRLEEHYRPDMVKSEALPRMEDGVPVLNDGFDREVLLEGTLCDHCGQEVPSGVEVLYHRRLGQISCPDCATSIA